MRYITTPIYYVNDNPHIGHAVTTLAADVLARYYKLKGEDVFFLTGTDEHGAKIAEAAEKAGKEPQAFTDEISQNFAQTWDDLHIEPDGFIRTTDPHHKAVVQHFLQDLYDKGAIYKGSYKGWYCIGCEEFKTETQIGPGNTCPTHNRPLIEVEEEAYLFKLTEFREQIKQAVESDTLKIRPESRKNEVLGFLKHEGLRDVAISRKNVAWGIPVPWGKDHTVYVWVDALLNYYSASQPDGPQFESGKKPAFPPSHQLIGKDILRFHAIIWPALLLASGKPLPKELFVHGYFTINSQKMSKSLGNVITPQQLINRYGVDATRYLLLAAVPFGADGDISLERLDLLYTSDLANNLGNLVSRVQAMLVRYREGHVPRTLDRQTSGKFVTARSEYIHRSIESLDFTDAVNELQVTMDSLNTFIEELKPWTLAKEGKDQELDEVLAVLAENVFLLGYLYWPILPQASAKVLSIFGSSIKDIDYDTLLTTNHTAGKTITPIDPLFPRLP
jgi:methionyl-tRNA synthetase